ncbi:bifunctional diaminohydroxyphosphoribosylaminopyrimidine deaminase/5-amino-6-(5-phosphoribosylamino)uracil reductase RibD [Secundilactobacillus folii]|uniref:Riboflavin biosynthesis protein RibD n=1 Tax=Secundilactobacillus folii TaxID=2678357 RepID=A0A7X2XX77_9LACO|nr:bifunctional diaminohydroxyphosphoribosylaminopyrimidine deaminase/5-amino-6-(5-phosphoribosylamino)uracil reductase RibD [Secundilactobacillus folii]MTV82780.1 bifunctional diaminohydroxyphosphoribosylaminopyrimidine deaminase/5-amino-6-(5-phosphoribosylamino)uracil reductase RibD [Secundilactobacillus folii]
MSDATYFQLAVDAAKQGTDTWTNPQVGAVIVKDDHLLAVGYHHRFGHRHAEIDALSQLDDTSQAAGATMYVTLEPCSHYGKTPPCAKRLAEVKIAKVVIGQLDPNPLVSGKGVAILQQHGIEVQIRHETGGLNAAYNFFYRQNRPWVTVKYAMSLDGKINAAGEQRTHLTETPALKDAQAVRRQHQAILVGEHTLSIDDPQLTVREGQPMVFPPVRIAVVHDVNDFQNSRHLFDDQAPTWIFSQTEASQQLPENVQVIVNSDWTPTAIVSYLAKKGIQSLLVEGGSAMQAAFIAAGLADEVIVYLAPILIGGTGLPAVVGSALSQQEHFSSPTVTQLGNDIKIQSRRQ